MARWSRRRFRDSWRGIRFRLGAALALALLPILIISAFQSRTAYLTEIERSRADMLRAAELSASAAQARIDGAVIVLETLRPESVGLYCAPRLSQIVATSDAYESLVRVSETGRVICASGSVSGQAMLQQPWFQRLRNGEHLAIARAEPGLFSEEPALIAAVRPERPLGAFDGAFVAVIRMDSLRPRSLTETSVEGVQVALATRDGQLLTATDEAAFPDRFDPSGLDGDFLTYTGPDGSRRAMTSAAFAQDDVYVLVSAPTQDLFGWAVANALGVFVMPIVTWLFALGVVMLVTDRIVIRWLYYLERVAAIHARGKHNVRPVHARNAPAEIRTLAQSMDQMVRAINARDGRLRESLREKDALMREIHHRVKNNLQVIISLLNMQQRALKDPAARAVMTDTRHRITALSLIYRALYQSETLKEVDIGVFLNDLVRQLVAADAVRGPLVETSVQADTLVVDPDKLAPLALWAVEAVSNAQKHAFAERGGKLSVRFIRGATDSVLEVEDDGPGVPPDAAPGGVGQTLMTAFARQLRGAVEQIPGPDGGLIVRLTFPTPEVAESAQAERNQAAS